MRPPNNKVMMRDEFAKPLPGGVHGCWRKKALVNLPGGQPPGSPQQSEKIVTAICDSHGGGSGNFAVTWHW